MKCIYDVFNDADLSESLLHAVRSRRIEHVSFLMAMGDGTEIFDDDGILLRESALWNYEELVRFFVDRGLDVRSHNDYSICVAASHGYDRITRFLIEHGADVNARDGYPLLAAARGGYDTIVDFLKQHGAH